MVSLRKLEPDDLPWLYSWENDAATWSAGSVHNPISRSDLRAYIASTTGDIYRDGQLRLIIVDDGASVGAVDLFDLDARNRKAAIGLYIAAPYRARGIGREAIRLLIDYAHRTLNLIMIYAVIGVSNTASAAIFRQLAFTPTARLNHWTLEDDAIVWQLCLDENVDSAKMA